MNSKMILGLGVGIAAAAAVGLYYKYKGKNSHNFSVPDSSSLKRKLSQVKRRAQREFDGETNPAMERVTKWAGH